MYMTMIETEDYQGSRELHLEARFLKDSKVFLFGTITHKSALELVQKLMYLETRPGTDRIRLYIDSPGGEVASGLMIYDVLHAMSKEVDIYCMGCAESMAALLLACGKKGHRHILPHARTMIHEPQLETGMGGSATSIRHLSDSIMETRNKLNQLLVRHTGRTIREINKATSFDNFMDADESIAFGLCDDIATDLF